MRFLKGFKQIQTRLVWCLGVEEFERDLAFIVARLNEASDDASQKKLEALKRELVRLNSERLVKINHSVMELVCAKYLILKGYEVEVEHLLNDLSCDLYAVKGLGRLIVEVETGYVPPEHALDPQTYCKARIASKICRYSGHAEKFGLGTPPHYILPVHPALTKPPRHRTSEELREIKGLCDLYYSSPAVSVEEIKNARLHTIYVLDVDQATVKETDPTEYADKTVEWSL